MPSSRAARSINRSNITAASGRPAPRYAMVGLVLVTTPIESTDTRGMRYGPQAIAPVALGITAPRPGYAPPSPNNRAATPTILPSRVNPIAACCVWPRPCEAPKRCSVRVSIQRTGRPTARAAAASTKNSLHT